MRRSVSEVIRRGFDNTVANWPLLLIRLGESLVAMMIVFATILAAVVPVVVSIVQSSRLDVEHPDRMLELLTALITEHGMLIAYLVVLGTVLLTFILAVRAFVEGGTARILFDGEAAADTRGGFAAFDMQRWFDGGKSAWWPIFLIYNIVGCIAVLGALLPLVVVGALVAIGGTGSAIVGCIVVPILIIAMIVLAIIVALWNQKAIVICVARGLGAVASVRAGWREVMDDFSRHFGVAALIALITFAVAAGLSVMNIASGFGHRAGLALAFAPMQLISSFAQSALSAAAGTWFVACFVALTGDNRR